MSASLTQEVARFSGVARHFCDLVDHRNDASDKAQFLAQLAASLADLVGAAFRLPSVGPTNSELSEDAESIRASFDLRDLKKTFADDDRYWAVFDPRKRESPVEASLSDDIADIYADLKEGLRLATRAELAQEALWLWRFSFFRHWGRHATRALVVIWTELADEF